MGKFKTENPWTEADLALAKQRWNVDRATASAIAAELGRTRNAVCGMIYRHADQFDARPQPVRRPARVKPAKVIDAQPAPVRQHWSREEALEAARLWADKLPIKDIADRLGQTVARVKRLVLNNRAAFPARYDTGSDGRRVAATVPVARATEPVPVRNWRDAPPRAPDDDPVTLPHRRADQCAYPLWNSFGPKPPAEGLLYCGAATGAREDAYCCFHRRLMVRSPAVRSDETNADVNDGKSRRAA